MSDVQVRHLQAWSRQEAAAIDRLNTNAQNATTALWAAFFGWYSASATTAIAKANLAIVENARTAAGNVGLAYVQEVLAALTTGRVPRVKLDLPAPRRGADMLQVYSRPAKVYRHTFATTGDTSVAYEAAIGRAFQLVEDDVMLARRDGEHQTMREAGVDRYRRVLHPELAKTGSCGLCVVASDRVYRIEDLMPIHGRCNCTVAPVSANADPAKLANEVDLNAFYKAAGSTGAADLKNVRVKVNHHGELGPVLTRSGDEFTGPRARRERTPTQAKNLLEKLTPVLAQLEEQKVQGQLVDIQLAYQRHLIAKVRTTAALAA